MQALTLYDDDDDDTIKSGPFANLMCPHEMQPIYMLPLTNGIKQLLTFCVFGFDFKTDFKKGSAMKKLASFFVGYLAKLAFIFLAFNSYISDYRKFQSREENNLDNLWQSSLVFLAIWCTSHNFSASLGLWGSFTIQSPAVIFKKDIEKSRYLEAASCWGFGNIRFPFFLGGARWLAFPKQVYALLLLPYVIPYMVLSYTTAILLAAWSILFTKCCCLFKVIWLLFAVVVCSIMYLFGSVQTGLQEIWERVWPFIYLFGVHLYATYVVPPFIALVYGIISCSSATAIWRGLGICAHEHEKQEGSGESLVQSCAHLDHDFDEIIEEEEAQKREDAPEPCDCCSSRLRKCQLFWLWFFPQRRLQIASDDRRTLLRLDWSRLSSDFRFTKACMAKLEPYRDELDEVTSALHDFSPFEEAASSDDEEDPICPTPYGKGLVDVCIGRETLLNYDVNEKYSPSLHSQLSHENDENTIDDALIQVVVVTIRSISQIALQQAITIWLIRTLSASDFEGMIEAMRQTVSKRRFDSYTRYLATLGEQKLQQAMNTVWGL